MYRGARPFGPRAAVEFDEIWACIAIEKEESQGEDDGVRAPEGEPPMYFPDEAPEVEPEVDAYEADPDPNEED